MIAAARSTDDLEQTAALGAGRIVAQPCDVQKALDALVNNAGVAVQQLLVDTTDEDWDTTMDTNVKGTTLLRDTLRGF
ncbi:hypothetical protein BH09ACT8_BH09ACT8_08420 [soil metagenome]